MVAFSVRCVLSKIGDYMSLDGLTDYLPLSRRTLYRMAQGGQLPCRKIRGRWLFRRKEIDAWFSDPALVAHCPHRVQSEEIPSRSLSVENLTPADARPSEASVEQQGLKVNIGCRA